MSARQQFIRRWAIRGLIPLLILLVGGYGFVRSRRTNVNVPTADVKIADFVDYSQLRGEVIAEKSVILDAPSNAGDLQILKLAKNGSTVKKGDVVVQFDPTDLRNRLQQSQTDLKQAEAQIEQTRAQGRLKEEQDNTTVAKSKFDVERARLDASKQEILSAIDGEKSKLSLADAEQVKLQNDQQLQSDLIGIDADVNSRKLRRDKAKFDVDRRLKNIQSMTLTAPVDGMVTLRQNFRSGGPFSASPEWHEGDRAYPGAAIVELPDLSTLQVTAQVDETERGRLQVGQEVNLRVDAVPDRDFKGKITEISPLTKPDFSTFPPTRNFAVTILLAASDPRLRPGMSASARVAVEKLPNAIILPQTAIFQKDGRSVAYVLRGNKFEARSVTVKRRGDGQVVIAEGIKSGEKVATRDPFAEQVQ